MTTQQIENVKELITALRSGKYTQGKGRLTQIIDGKPCDCCLGVACKIAMDKIPLQQKIIGEASGVVYDIGDLEYDMVLPTVVMKMFGFKSHKGDFAPEDSLASMNDRGVSFNEIADFLEQQLDNQTTDLFA